ncbi:alpha/beta hydrolase [Streptomyces sp. NPDC005820]|uniref:alpha/beta hydrolase n=1 Tax=Streptomyces sp. NPDC005820 TaxID=3157069 RepID=UPI0033E8E155
MSFDSPSPARPRRRGRFAVGVLATALFAQLLGGTSVAAPAPEPLAWQPCESPYGEGAFECATVTVPVDWERPQGATVDLALARHRATDPGHRIGSLLVNPGGPGGSGREFAFAAPFSFSPDLLERFDIVGFDPRGIGLSDPVTCDEELIAAQEPLLFPDSGASFAALRRAGGALGDDCSARSGSLVDHMDSTSVARDMDAIRAGLGEERISYYGVSYGTALGERYAELFPKRVRAMTLDSVIDHSLDTWSLQKTRAIALEETFGQFADWCARTASCVLHGRDVRALFDSLYRRAAAGELIRGGDVLFTDEHLQRLAQNFLYSTADWFRFAEFLTDLDTPDPAEARSSPRLRGEPAAYAYVPVLCQDFALEVPSYATLAGYQRRLARLAPVTRFSPLAWTDLTGCQGWPTRVTNPQHRLRIDGTPPILVTNSRYDVATPHAWGAGAARQIGGEAVFLTYDGAGHGDYWTSPCVRDAIDTYLTTLATPGDGAHCPAVWPTDSSARRQSPGDGLVNPLPEPPGTGTRG